MGRVFPKNNLLLAGAEGKKRWKASIVFIRVYLLLFPTYIQSSHGWNSHFFDTPPAMMTSIERKDLSFHPRHHTKDRVMLCMLPGGEREIWVLSVIDTLFYFIDGTQNKKKSREK